MVVRAEIQLVRVVEFWKLQLLAYNFIFLSLPAYFSENTGSVCEVTSNNPLFAVMYCISSSTILYTPVTKTITSATFLFGTWLAKKCPLIFTKTSSFSSGVWSRGTMTSALVRFWSSFTWKTDAGIRGLWKSPAASITKHSDITDREARYQMMVGCIWWNQTKKERRHVRQEHNYSSFI